MQEFFTYDSLLRFFEHLKSIAPLVQFYEAGSKDGILLRHDIDFDITPAYRLACLEHDVNVKSTFFVMPTSEFYNPLSARNATMLREMLRMGFEVGLHFDPVLVYSYESPAALEARFKAELRVLKYAIAPYEVWSVSLHQPGNGGTFPLFKGFTNAYDPKFFSADTYLSDSCRIFHGKDPYAFVEQARNRTVQLLLHPVYYSEHGRDYKMLLNHYITNLKQNSREFFRGCVQMSEEVWE